MPVKGLTAGYLPLSVVLTTDTVYNAFYDDYETMRAFLHSHSYTGNPIGCAVALATLDIFRDENVIENNRQLSRCMAESVAHLADHPNVGDIRQHGMTLAIEMVPKTKPAKPRSPGRNAVASRCTSMPSPASPCCARWATWCTSLRLT